METVQLQCGHCKKPIGIRVEHLGMQVKCPHCQQVVQTPPRSSVPEPAPAQESALQAHDSIFGGAEPSDSVIDIPPLPKVESNGTPDIAPPPASTETTPPPSEPGVEADFSQFKRKQAFDKSVIPLLVLIFLVPYALMTTAFITYLLLTQGRSAHPYEYLPDPATGKDKGVPRPARMQPAPGLPLADSQKTGLGKSIKAGDLLITPKRVLFTSDGDLKMIVRAKNVSASTRFSPLNAQYFKPTKGGIEPYAYLESKSGSLEKINAFDPFFYKNADATGEPLGDALLAPGEEVTITLTTYEKFRPHVGKIEKATGESYTWRLQVRRGLVKYNGKDVSATTVVGVDFDRGEIEAKGKS